MKNKNKPFFYDEKKISFSKIILIIITSGFIVLFFGYRIPGVRQIIAEPLFAVCSYTWNGIKEFVAMTRMYREPAKQKKTYTPLELPEREVLFAESLENLSVISSLEDPLADLRQTPTPSEYERVAQWEYLDPNLNYAVRSGDNTVQETTNIQLIPPVFEHADLYNDGAAILSSDLRYWGIVENQYHIAAQIHQDSLDPFISFSDLKEYVSSNYPDFSIILRDNGDTNILQAVLLRNIPVIIFAETKESLSYWPQDDRISGHYYLLLGYNSREKTFSYQDTYNGNTMQIEEDRLLSLWYPYQRSYILIFPAEKDEIVQEALSENYFEELNLQQSLNKFKTDSEMLPNNPYAQYNLGTALHKIGDEKGAWECFMQAKELSLPQRFIHYRNEILETALILGYADDITEITAPQYNRNSHDEMLTMYRGWASVLRGDIKDGTELFYKAKKINPNSESVSYAIKYSETMIN